MAASNTTRERRCGTAGAPIWALEQLVSCRIRHAGELASRARPAPRPNGDARRGRTNVKHLLALGRSSERLALHGALMKRRVLLTAVRPRAATGAAAT